MLRTLKGFALAVSLSWCLPAFSQVYNPASWKFSLKQVSDTEYSLQLHADIQKGWHVYSMFVDSNVTVPTQFTFAPSADYARDGATGEGNPVSKFDKILNATLKFFENVANFTQNVKVRNPKGFTIKGNVYYICCNDSMCLPPKTVNFSFAIPPVSIHSSQTSSGYWGILLLGLIAGFVALITPCVFPMIPLTVSFFLKRNQSRAQGVRSAITYSTFIIFIYVGLGELITLIYGPSGLNALASDGWVNFSFFLIFIIFGFSFLGAFEIGLPSSLATKFDQESEQGGLIGIFFMALTLCVVSFSCTGLYLGNLLAAAALNGSYWSLVIGMFGFSFALSLPFALFAIFPSWIKSLPKSGNWLNTVKVVFGLLEIAFALKFLSTADLVGLHIKWLHFHINGPMGILKREVFLAVWIVVFLIIGFYLMGKIKFKYDADVPHLSVFRLMVAIIAFSFSAYLIPGLFGAPLKLISGFPPPSWYSEGWGFSQKEDKEESSPVVHTERTGKVGCPLNLNCFHDFNEARNYAKSINKPVMIDFTGFSCVNCRKMEENVWADSRVLSVIKNDYVLVSLYVDDPTELPDSMKSVSRSTGEKIDTYGEKWSDMETASFSSNSQPLYVLLDDNGNELTMPKGYTPDIEQYLLFLEQGKSNFHNLRVAVN